jgi:hypothetical protein
MGPTAGLDNAEKAKLFTLPGLELRPLGRHPVASHYTDCASPAPNHKQINTRILCLKDLRARYDLSRKPY